MDTRSTHRSTRRSRRLADQPPDDRVPRKRPSPRKRPADKNALTEPLSGGQTRAKASKRGDKPAATKDQLPHGADATQDQAAEIKTSAEPLLEKHKQPKAAKTSGATSKSTPNTATEPAKTIVSWNQGRLGGEETIQNVTFAGTEAEGGDEGRSEIKETDLTERTILTTTSNQPAEPDPTPTLNAVDFEKIVHTRSSTRIKKPEPDQARDMTGSDKKVTKMKSSAQPKMPSVSRAPESTETNEQDPMPYTMPRPSQRSGNVEEGAGRAVVTAINSAQSQIHGAVGFTEVHTSHEMSGKKRTREDASSAQRAVPTFRPHTALPWPKGAVSLGGPSHGETGNSDNTLPSMGLWRPRIGSAAASQTEQLVTGENQDKVLPPLLPAVPAPAGREGSRPVAAAAASEKLATVQSAPPPPPTTIDRKQVPRSVAQQLLAHVPHLADITKCANCGLEPKKYLVCAQCQRTRYCGKYCQVWDWKLHELVCARSDNATDEEVRALEAWAKDFWDGAVQMLQENVVDDGGAKNTEDSVDGSSMDGDSMDVPCGDSMDGDSVDWNSMEVNAAEGEVSDQEEAALELSGEGSSAAISKSSGSEENLLGLDEDELDMEMSHEHDAFTDRDVEQTLTMLSDAGLAGEVDGGRMEDEVRGSHMEASDRTAKGKEIAKGLTPSPPSMYWSRAMSLHLAKGGAFEPHLFQKQG